MRDISDPDSRRRLAAFKAPGLRRTACRIQCPRRQPTYGGGSEAPGRFDGESNRHALRAAYRRLAKVRAEVSCPVSAGGLAWRSISAFCGAGDKFVIWKFDPERLFDPGEFLVCDRRL